MTTERDTESSTAANVRRDGVPVPVRFRADAPGGPKRRVLLTIEQDFTPATREPALWTLDLSIAEAAQALSVLQTACMYASRQP